MASSNRQPAGPSRSIRKMRYCFSCRHMTSGQPLFCRICGRSFEAKLCPRLHHNPRSAQACSTCGSRDLSIPQRQVSWLSKLFVLSFSAPIGFVLFLLSVAYFVYYVYRLILDPLQLLPTMALGLVLGLFWLAFLFLPSRFARRNSSRQRVK